MSKIGRMPIAIKSGVTVTTDGKTVTVTGPKGTMAFPLPIGITVTIETDKVVVSQVNKGEELTKAAFGLTRATINNMVKGVADGFTKKLELAGVGYRAQTSGAELTLSLGFSHPVKIKAPAGITFAVAENVISISGIDPVLVGNTAAQIRGIKPPEPYKGKGIKYVGEVIRKKAGKAAKAVGGAGK